MNRPMIRMPATSETVAQPSQHEQAGELSACRRALFAANTPPERALAANRLFRCAHGLWLAGKLDITAYKLVLAEIDAKDELPRRLRLARRTTALREPLARNR